MMNELPRRLLLSLAAFTSSGRFPPAGCKQERWAADFRCWLASGLLARSEQARSGRATPALNVRGKYVRFGVAFI